MLFFLRNLLIFVQVSGKESGEAGTVSAQAVADSIEAIQSVIKAGPNGDGSSPYTAENIGNADEFALFIAAAPSRNLFRKSRHADQRKGSKLAKQRVTGLAVVNATGTLKWKMLVIGKSKNPRALQKLTKEQRDNLPCTYRDQAKGWMTTEIWNDFLVEFDAYMRKQNRQFLLICDNFSGHAVTAKLTNVKVRGFAFVIFLIIITTFQQMQCLFMFFVDQVAYLAPNTTSITQPLDQGIIRALKAAYRRFLVQFLAARVKMKVDFYTQAQSTHDSAATSSSSSSDSTSPSNATSAEVPKPSSTTTVPTDSTLSTAAAVDSVPAALHDVSQQKQAPLSQNVIAPAAALACDSNATTSVPVGSSTKNLKQNTLDGRVTQFHYHQPQRSHTQPKPHSTATSSNPSHETSHSSSPPLVPTSSSSSNQQTTSKASSQSDTAITASSSENMSSSQTQTSVNSRPRRNAGVPSWMEKMVLTSHLIFGQSNQTSSASQSRTTSSSKKDQKNHLEDEKGGIPADEPEVDVLNKKAGNDVEEIAQEDGDQVDGDDEDDHDDEEEDDDDDDSDGDDDVRVCASIHWMTLLI
jgi:hypothetical protein